MCHLQEMHEDYADKGLVIVGVNCSDALDVALQFLDENGATFPNVLDESAAARKTAFEDYQTLPGWSAVPLSYIIDREGKIATGWYGKHRGSRVRGILRGLGIE
jgi:peroxiredoxin